MSFETQLTADGRTPRPVANKVPTTVVVENIPETSNINEIVALFRSLVGEIMNYQLRQHACGKSLELSFSTPDLCKKALCMSGYTVKGSSLSVSMISSKISQQVYHKSPETRRNLYVLGIPFGFTKSDLSKLFASYGMVSHCVILATVDNASRRRGFVVMSCHDEAKFAMSSLSRTVVQGHMLDISWAVVQRSQGFLDGDDRLGVLDSSLPLLSTISDSQVSLPSINATNPATPQEIISYAASYMLDDSTILVKNLSKLIFSEVTDLHPLFYPFGDVKKLTLQPSTTRETFESTMSVLVEYATANNAKEARAFLHGQSYANHILDIYNVANTSDDKIGKRFPTSVIQSHNINVPLEQRTSNKDPQLFVKPAPANPLSRPFSSQAIRPPTQFLSHSSGPNLSSSSRLSENRNQNRAPPAASGDPTMKYSLHTSSFNARNTAGPLAPDASRFMSPGLRPPRRETDSRQRPFQAPRHFLARNFDFSQTNPKLGF